MELRCHEYKGRPLTICEEVRRSCIMLLCPGAAKKINTVISFAFYGSITLTRFVVRQDQYANVYNQIL